MSTDGEQDNTFKTALVVEARTDLRIIVKDVLKEFGVEAMAFAAINETIAHIKANDPPDWIITFLDKEGKTTAYHLLMICLLDKKFHNTRISLLLDNDETWCLPLAFEFGLFTFHMKPFSKTSFQGEIESLWVDLGKADVKHTFVAARFFRQHLSDNEQFSDLLGLEETLVGVFPEVPECYINLAESQFLAGKIDDAKITLKQAKFQEHDLQIAVKQLADLVGEDELKEDLKMSEFAKAFSVKTCLVIDSDDSVQKQLSEFLGSLGIEDIQGFADGEAAYEWVKAHGEPSLVLMEWKLPKLSGDALVQRFRELGFTNTIIFLMTSLVQKEDEPLLTEMGIAGRIDKPFMKEKFLSLMMASVRKNKYPSDVIDLMTKYNKAMSADDKAERESIYTKIRSKENVPEVLLKTLAAQHAYDNNDLDDAKNQVVQAFKLGSQELLVLNILGKIMLKLGDKESALKCFEHAQKYSSKNLNRLLSIADLNTEMGNDEAAEEVLDQAKAVDESNQAVVEMEAKVSISKGNVNRANKALKKLSSISNLVSMMNARAVALSKADQPDEAIKIYQDTVDAIPEDREGERKSVTYNMALAYAKLNRLDDAANLIEAELDDKTLGRIYEKAASLLARIRKAQNEGAELTLNLAKEEHEGSVHEVARPVAFDAQPGDICLHLLYTANELDEKSSGMLETARTYIKKYIQKEESS